MIASDGILAPILKNSFDNSGSGAIGVDEHLRGGVESII